jgi:hypothetical protein
MGITQMIAMGVKALVWTTAVAATVIHFLGFWLSYARSSELRLEVFATGVLLPPVILAIFAGLKALRVIVYVAFGLGLGMLTVLIGGLAFLYLGPTGVDYYESMGWLLYIFVAVRVAWMRGRLLANLSTLQPSRPRTILQQQRLSSDPSPGPLTVTLSDGWPEQRVNRFLIDSLFWVPRMRG